MMFVIYGVLAQIPIGDMFLAGILPGLLLSAAFAGVIALVGFRKGFPKGRWYSSPEAVSALLQCLPAMLIPIAIIGGVLFGIATPTESAAVASLIAFVIGWLVYGELKPGALFGIFKRTAVNASMIVFMIAAAFLFLLIVNVILLVVGMLIDGIAAIILITPILLPIAMTNYDISPYQFGVVMSLNLVLGLLTPPVGVGLYIASTMSGVSPGGILRALWPFLIAVGLVLILLSRFAWLSTALIG
jgi:TRAP-type C4-dicarboxylate transport system permease large subunit